MILKLVRTPGIYLVGFMGSGKTTVGQLLAERLGWNFVDLDDDIEAAAHATIADIFDQQGEERFRQLETAAIRKRVCMVRGGSPTVLALGGGAFTRPENVELLTDHGVTVWLDCPLDLARQRVAAFTHRPLARDPVRFEQLFTARLASYGKAEYRVQVTGNDPQAVVEAICLLPIF